MDSRPLIAELEAIGRAIAFAEDTGCALHIVHVSSGRGVALVTEARRRGVDVTCETCPHYLFLTPDDVERLGAVAKCAPPVRERARSVGAAATRSHMVTSDHSPSSPGPQAGRVRRRLGRDRGLPDDADAAGRRVRAAGARAAHVHRRRRALRHAAQGPDRARRRRRPRAGRPDRRATRCSADDLLYRHPISPWIGRRLRARVVRTLLRGSDPAPGAGRLLTPATERIPVT